MKYETFIPNNNPNIHSYYVNEHERQAERLTAEAIAEGRKILVVGRSPIVAFKIDKDGMAASIELLSDGMFSEVEIIGSDTFFIGEHPTYHTLVEMVANHLGINKDLISDLTQDYVID